LDGKIGEMKKAFFSYNYLTRNIFWFLINKDNNKSEFTQFLLKYILKEAKAESSAKKKKNK
jgi:hypothetical protein